MNLLKEDEFFKGEKLFVDKINFKFKSMSHKTILIGYYKEIRCQMAGYYKIVSITYKI